ncbi:MAG: hypothetical protein RMJ33_01085 [Saprospiraceae bacterium]|nr:hypothetical protein [Saprospiraceae bacterium]MDW8228403.1 hypothetical protein [Saprospiraceae bacterium]
MRIPLLFLCFSLCACWATGQTPATYRKGFTFGFSAGIGALHLTTDAQTQRMTTGSFPNLRIGYWLGPRLLAQILLPGAIYVQNDKHRGFEGILLSAQYWPAERWWLLAGGGLALDAPAFWTIDDPSKADFRWGTGAALSTGYEIWRRRNSSLDIFYRFYTGRAGAGDEAKKGVAHHIGIGFNIH